MRKAIATIAGILCLATSAHAAQNRGTPGTDAGRDVYRHWCSACHDPGERHPGTMALGAKYAGQVPAALVEREDLDPEVIRLFVRHGITIMPSFRKTEISDAELDALVGYLTAKRPGLRK